MTTGLCSPRKCWHTGGVLPVISRLRYSRNECERRPIIVGRTDDSDSELAKARHLAYLLECLAEFDQLNVTPGAGVKQSAIDHAIHMPPRDSQ